MLGEGGARADDQPPPAARADAAQLAQAPQIDEARGRQRAGVERHVKIGAPRQRQQRPRLAQDGQRRGQRVGRVQPQPRTAPSSRARRRLPPTAFCTAR